MCQTRVQHEVHFHFGQKSNFSCFVVIHEDALFGLAWHIKVLSGPSTFSKLTMFGIALVSHHTHSKLSSKPLLLHLDTPLTIGLKVQGVLCFMNIVQCSRLQKCVL